MSDKYDEVADFLVRRTLELYRTPHVALDWEKIAKDEMANFLREAFPAPSGQGEDERQTAHASNCSILPECKCKREALVPKDARELMLRIDLANRHPRFTIEQGADEIDRFAQARIREAAQGDDDRLIVIRNYVENAPRKSVYDKQARLYALEAIDALRSRPAEPITRSCQNCGARNAGCVGSDKGICDNWGPWPEPVQAAPSEEDRDGNA